MVKPNVIGGVETVELASIIEFIPRPSPLSADSFPRPRGAH